MSGLDASDGSLTDVIQVDAKRLVPRDSDGTGIVDSLELVAQGDFVYVIDRGTDTLLIFDVTDPDNVVARGTTSENLSSPYALDVQGDFVYVADRSTASLHVLMCRTLIPSWREISMELI